MNSVVCKKISHRYKNAFVEEKVLEDIDLTLEKGKIYCLLGPSGSGKTTLLNIMGGLLNPSDGEVFIEGEDITKYNEDQLASLRVNKIGYIFQNYNLIPFLNVKDNIFLQHRIAGNDISSKMELYKRIVTRLGLDGKENSYADQLSGGQQHRVAIARCLIMEPSIILADEPTGNLDAENTNVFIRLIKDVMKGQDTTFVIVTHDERLCEYCDHVIRLFDHKIQYVS